MSRLGIIPKIFQKTDGGHFATCVLCERNVLRPAVDYFIEKSFRQLPGRNKAESIIEYAMCSACALKMHHELSVESRQRIQQYFQERANFKLQEALLEPKRQPVGKWIAQCLVTRQPLKKQPEFSVYAHAYGKRLVYGAFPYALSGTVMEEINELLSAHSRQVLDDFIGNHFSGPPEVAEILKRRPVLV